MKVYIFKKLSLMLIGLIGCVSLLLTLINYLGSNSDNWKDSVIIVIACFYFLILGFSYLFQILYIIFLRKEYKNKIIMLLSILLPLLCFIFIGYFSMIGNYVDCLLLTLVSFMIQFYIYYKIDITSINS